MGKDKFENEELLKYGFPEDIWFHVDNVSSAHVYLRLNREEGESWENMPESCIQECCQLVKDNSIEGCKKDLVKVVYTPFLNLKKTEGMDTGQVGFHQETQRKYVHKVAKDKVLLKLLNKTKKEDYPDLQQLYKERKDLDKQAKVEEYYQQQKQIKAEKAEKQAQKELKNYSSFMKKENMVSNKNAEAEEDFC